MNRISLVKTKNSNVGTDIYEVWAGSRNFGILTHDGTGTVMSYKNGRGQDPAFRKFLHARIAVRDGRDL